MVSERADFCVGYFNLRGWRKLQELIDNFAGGEGNCCRLLVGMHKLPSEELEAAMSLSANSEQMDFPTVVQLKKVLVDEFRHQLTVGAPSNADEATLRKLVDQIKDKKVVVKFFVRHPLHAKLYLLCRNDFNNPITGFLGSSNLTLAGLTGQGELDIDVLDQDACNKLQDWFNDRWEDPWCLDVSDDLVKVIDDSWARKDLIPPYYIYLKIAYHLAQEARSGISEYEIPHDLKDRLLDFQSAAVKIAAHHLDKRRGVLIGDVVGLGKTLMASTLARVFQDEKYLETLVICPKNLTNMWEDYFHDCRIVGKVLSISRFLNEVENLRRYRIVIIDESQNLRNREGKKYKAIQDYIHKNESRCILLSATPYNKSYEDLSAQLRLFVNENQDLGIRPEKLFQSVNELEFTSKYQIQPKSLAAFEKSPFADDWRELMRLYLVRRTRSFIKENYACKDESNGRYYLVFHDGNRYYFPDRIPKTVKFSLDENSPNDQYARLYSDPIVSLINNLNLPRYGLGNYIVGNSANMATPEEKKQLDNLSKAGKRLKGFSRTNLFKRLESSGKSFFLSVDRHILRNYVYIHAIENNLPIPIGIQDVELMDTSRSDEDTDSIKSVQTAFEYDDDADNNDQVPSGLSSHPYTEDWYKAAAKIIYENYQGKKGFKWIRPVFFSRLLVKDLKTDAVNLLKLLLDFGEWNPQLDTKLEALKELLTRRHSQEKVLIFTQFADTVDYLQTELKNAKIQGLEGVTGAHDDPTSLAWRFSPISNKKVIQPGTELRVLIATDVLSEGQNLQDCSMVVNYDLPWALVRLIQRVGRVDRIGQKSEKIFCYSFLPAEGLEKIIRLRKRVKQRLTENGEVIGSDERYFEDDLDEQGMRDLYTEKSGIFDKDADNEVDLASYAYQIWKNATQKDQSIARKIESLPDVVYSTREHLGNEKEPQGVLLYMKTAELNDSLVWINKKGESVTQSQLAILNAARCEPVTPAIPRHEMHHELVRKGIAEAIKTEKITGGQLGRTSGARYRTYMQLKSYHDELIKHEPLFAGNDLSKAIDDIFKYPLRPLATDLINRELKNGISDEKLAELVINLRAEDRLSIRHAESRKQEPRIICSLGLFSKE